MCYLSVYSIWKYFFLWKVNIKPRHSEIKDFNCLMQECRKWHLWPSCIIHICQKFVQEGRKWHLRPSCIKYICQIKNSILPKMSLTTFLHSANELEMQGGPETIA